LFFPRTAIGEIEGRTFEKLYLEIGYKTLEESVNDFESHFNKELALPLRLPPLPFTHYFGRFNDFDGENNDHLEVEFINEKHPENYFRIHVRPIKYGITFKESYKHKDLLLKDGNYAKYMTISGSNSLIFEKGNWQYIINVDKRLSKLVPPKSLVEIANSIHTS
jgi:hypothetical protein